MIRQLVLFTALWICSVRVVGQTDESATDSMLSALPGIKVISKTVNYSPYRLEYQLSIKQPVDHGDSAKGFFYQQLHLIHRGFSRPMVMETEGYNGDNTGCELEKILHCNDLDVEFRYFNQSRPDTLNWEYCSFEQATADLHHIRQIFRTLYHSKWISTGISRGGETALVYKYFFPRDVDATVAYVAPLPNDIEDKRIYDFLDTAGGIACVRRIRNVQVFMLQHEKEVLERLPLSVKQLHYKAVGGLGAALEYAIMEYPFAFWQISDINPNDIPVNSNLNDYYNHVMAVFGGDFSLFSLLLSDENGVDPFVPHYYMTYQTGYYKYNLRPFKNYLHYLKGPNASAAFLPAAVPRKPFDPEFEKKVIAWLSETGNDIVYIYGGRDTWTACKIAFNNSVNSRTFIMPGANHFMARIKHMPLTMQSEFAASLEHMTGLKVDLTALK